MTLGNRRFDRLGRSPLGCWFLMATALFNAGNLTGCAHWSVQTERVEQRELALNRWQSCLSRQWQARQRDASLSPDVVINDCDGHRRDVLHTYPAHLAPQLDRLLRTHAQQSLANALNGVSASTPRSVSLP